MSKRTGGVPYYSVPEWVRWERAYAKEHYEGDTLAQALAEINRKWEAQK
ncbi:MAG: hypothetical protein M3Q75_02135 [Gemmatimonadota bacterium]|nr:hypothetical protein [Gemmatimonadota bacterium]